MATQAQRLANQANAQLSTGPTTREGKAVSSKNNLRHGLTGPFMILAWESKEEYATFKADLFAEHQPATLTEEMLVEDMAQSHWLRKRAITLQTLCFRSDLPAANQPKELALYLRYQTTHDRAFYKALNQLQKLRAEKRRLGREAEESKNGFVSQERKAAEEARRRLNEQRKEAQEKRRENEEIRRQEMHQARVWLAEAQAERHETERKIAELVKMPRASQSQAA